MTESHHIKEKTGDKQNGLGTFSGVFTPSILTILGIILFLRLGYVVGSAGLGRALGIIALANVISILTSVSLSAIATNIKIKGGGDYYLISRTLGVEFGGAIGIVLFLAQSVSIAFYCIGFGEAITGMFPNALPFPPRIIAALAVGFLFILAWLGADFAAKFQHTVMVLLGLALLSFFWGAFTRWQAPLILHNWVAPQQGPHFWVLFAIFFPAVTGFTQGVSMSGDLKNPGKSLPLGTFLAVGLSIVIYFGMAVVFAGCLSHEALTKNYNAMWRIARVNVFIHAGVIAATLSSAMASFLGAPRILQSLSKDRIFPFLACFAKGHGPTENPRPAVLLSLTISWMTIAFGNLNVIAPVVSMFFLVSYGLLNYATFYEARSASPSFRPRFRFFDYRLSLLGFLACLGVMLAIDITAGIIAVAVLFAVYQYLKRTAGPARWADSRRAHYLQQIRENLIAVNQEPEHPRNWQPQIIALSENDPEREYLLRFASWIQGGSGLTTLVQFLTGNDLKTLRQRKEAEAQRLSEINAWQIRAFPRTVASADMGQALYTFLQGYGLGPVKANTFLVNFKEVVSPAPAHDNVIHPRGLRTVFRLDCNLIMLNAEKIAWQNMMDKSSEKARIDVWWWNDTTSQFMLLLAYLMTRDDKWCESPIRVLAGCYKNDSPENLNDLQNLLNETRIAATPEIVPDVSANAVLNYSSDAAMVFFPFQLGGGSITWPSDVNMQPLLEKLPVTAMVLAAQDIDLDAEPEEGKPAEIAEAMDAIEDAIRRSNDTQKNAEKAGQTADAAADKLNKMINAAEPGVNREMMIRIENAAKDADVARDKAEKAAQKAAKARAVAEQLTREAEETLGIFPKEDNGAKEGEG